MLPFASTEEAGMKAPRLFRRWLRPELPASTLPGRTSVSPPAVWGQAEPAWKMLWGWLRASDAPGERRLHVLAEARRDFADALADIPAADACDLRRRSQSARSLRELWHLRAELYSVVACHRSQAEADRRLRLVNRHFPTSTTQNAPSSAARPSQRHDA
jgi:hypothetical protein